VLCAWCDYIKTVDFENVPITQRIVAHCSIST